MTTVLFTLTLWINTPGGTLTDLQRLANYANKIGIKRNVSLKECESYKPKIKKFVENELKGTVGMYCRGE